MMECMKMYINWLLTTPITGGALIIILILIVVAIIYIFDN